MTKPGFAGMEIRMIDVENVIMQEIADKRISRDSVAYTYAFAIVANEDINFGRINRAIVDRWSKSALKYIKTKAWRLVER